jgi:hypothetical protein
MPQVSIYWLAEHAEKDPRTIKKRIDSIARDSKGRIDCR